MSSEDLSFVCEICGLKVRDKEKSIRVVVDTCVSDGEGGGASGDEDYEIVLSVFHRDCAIVTSSSRDCDAIPYIMEAREAVSEILSSGIFISRSEEYGKN